jgi:hypothetical protein
MKASYKVDDYTYLLVANQVADGYLHGYYINNR